jgi:hypothetical protein
MTGKHTWSWQRCCYLSFAIIVIQFVSTHLLLKVDHSHSQALSEQTHDQVIRQSRQSIKIDLHGEIADSLTERQCSDEFPRLYFEVDRATAYWRARGHQISAGDLDVSWRSELKFPSEGGALRVLIHDNELRVVESRMSHGNPAFRARGISLLSLLNSAVKSATAGGEKLPTIEAAIVLEDIVDYPTPDGTHSLWTWTSNMSDPTHDRHWLIPNFDFFGAGTCLFIST